MKRHKMELVEYQDTLAIQHTFNDRLVGEVPVPVDRKEEAEAIVQSYNDAQPEEH